MKWTVVTLVALLSACAPDKDGLTPHKPAVTALAVHSGDLDSQDCFDVKMETWFVAFEKYQREGETMGIADAKAWSEAEEAFKECSGNISAKLTSRAKE